jgi:predicted nucleic acid-binding protein
MLVVDAGALFEFLTRTPAGQRVGQRLDLDDRYAAPHILDVEVLGVIRRHFFFGELDRTAATQAVWDLQLWVGERFDHRPLLGRAWALRNNVRGWDAMYVALAEALRATLLTTDERLGRVAGLFCAVEVIPR